MSARPRRFGRQLLVAVGVAVAPAVALAARPHRIEISIKGPLALVEVERPFGFDAPEAGRGGWNDELAVDLALPEGASLAGATLEAPGERLAVSFAAAADAAARFDAHVRGAGLLVKPRPFEDGIDARAAVVGRRLDPTTAARWRLRYRFVAPLRCDKGRFVLRMPGPPAASPTSASVTASFDLGAGRRPTGVTADGRSFRAVRKAISFAAPARSAWELSFAPSEPQADVPLAAHVAGGNAFAAGLCRPAAAKAAAPAPARLVLVIDRSRSVGAPGVAIERDLAKELLRGLPPTLRFNAVLFDRSAEALFPTFRTATGEALGALDERLAPAALQNGTGLAAALRLAADLVRREPEPAPTWMIVLTDGALPDGEDAGALRAAVRGLSAPQVDVAVLAVRPADDEPLGAGALSRLAALPAALGGIARVLPPSESAAAVPRLIEDLRAGGDLLDVAFAREGGRRLPLVDAAAPGDGAIAILGSSPFRGAAVTWQGSHGARAVGGRIASAPIPAAWAAAIGGARTAGFAAGRRLALWIAAAPPAAPEERPVARGEMERLVVKNALAIGFKPRARACYLSRPVKSAADVALSGRVRLELQLERGELVDAAITRSTLGRPEIERCLREAAFAVEVPRAFAADAPVLAVLNLVFAPATPPKRVEPAPVGDEIELILGPPSDADPLQLVPDGPGG